MATSSGPRRSKHAASPPGGRAALAARCREAGRYLTPQRQAIHQALAACHDHPTPEALFERARRRLPSLSLATVYKTLDALVELGLARELPVTGKRKRYDANMEQHHHLVCSRCSRVQDHYDAALDRLAPQAQLAGFTVQRVTVQIHGLCPGCARTGRAR